jgi:GNAT superfamily N-acetyltransferase
MSDNTISIHAAETRDDAQSLLHLIEQLAKFEKLQGPDALAKERFYHDGFVRNPPRFSALLTYLGDQPKPCGYAIYFETYSTFLCKPTLYLEDIFVLPEARSKGIGSKLLSHLVQIGKKNGCGRIEWECLDWNTKAQEFYNRIGAKCHTEWMHYRMDETGIAAFVSIT